MAYEKHEMSVMLFSKEDDIFTDTELTSDEDNEWGGDKDYNYGDNDDPDSSVTFDW